MQANSEQVSRPGSERQGAGGQNDGVASGLDRLFEATQDLDERVRALARERPFVAVLGAVAVGFVMGRLFRSSERVRR